MRRVRVVDPDLAAVGDDQLLVGLDILPAEQARRGQRDAAAGCFLELAVDVVDGLRELPVQTLEAVGEGIQLLARTGEGGGRQQQGQHDEVADCARSEEHTSELQSLMRISYAVFCLKKKKQQI